MQQLGSPKIKTTDTVPKEQSGANDGKSDDKGKDHAYSREQGDPPAD